MSSAIPFIVLVVCCYFLYPSWKGFGFQGSYQQVFFCWSYLVILVLLLKWLVYRTKNAITSEIFSSYHGKGESVAVYGALLCFAVLQIWFLPLPILSGSDEPAHVIRQLHAWQDLSTSRVYALVIFGATTVLLTISMVVLLRYPEKSFAKPIFWRFGGRFHLFFLPLGLLVLSYLILYGNMNFALQLNGDWGKDFRWTPLSTVLGITSISVFGISEWASRIVPFLFYLGTGLYVYRIVESEADHTSGIAALLVCLGSPIFFAYGHLDYKETGGAFFLTVGIFYLLRFLRYANLYHLSLCFCAIAAGYLMRRPSLILLFAIPAFLLWDLWCKKRAGTSWQKLKLLLVDEFVLFLIVAMIILPWMYLTKDIRPYHFHENNFLDSKIAFAYFGILPGSVTWPTVILAIVGLVTAMLKKQRLGIVAIVSFLLIYILFTADEPYWIPVQRFSVLMVPPIALLAALAVNALGRWRNYFIVVLVFSVCFHLASWFFNIGKPWFFPANTATFSSYPYYPFDQIVRALKEKNIPAGNVLYPAFWQPASTVYYFYNDIHEYRDTIPAWKASKDRRSSIADLNVKCEAVNCNALVLRLEKTGDSTKVAWVTDLPGNDVLADSVPGFRLVHISFIRNNGLALLVPIAKKP